MSLRQPRSGSVVVWRQHGGTITSNAGALLLRAECTGVCRRAAECFQDYRDPSSASTVPTTKRTMTAAGAADPKNPWRPPGWRANRASSKDAGCRTCRASGGHRVATPPARCWCRRHSFFHGYYRHYAIWRGAQVLCAGGSRGVVADGRCQPAGRGAGFCRDELRGDAPASKAVEGPSRPLPGNRDRRATDFRAPAGAMSGCPRAYASTGHPSGARLHAPHQGSTGAVRATNCDWATLAATAPPRLAGSRPWATVRRICVALRPARR